MSVNISNLEIKVNSLNMTTIFMKKIHNQFLKLFKDIVNFSFSLIICRGQRGKIFTKFEWMVEPQGYEPSTFNPFHP